MDARCFLTAACSAASLTGCALIPHAPAPQNRPIEVIEPPAALALPAALLEPLPPTARTYFSVLSQPTHAPNSSDASPSALGVTGRAAIAAANRQARAASRSDAFVGGMQVFAYEPGRVYEVWTAPLRVTALTLAPGETVTSKAAGDTVRWQIGESASGAGATSRTHVLIKPLQTGLETNLILTTNQGVYLLSLRSGTADSFNAAVAWDTQAPASEPLGGVPAPAADQSLVTPRGPIDTRYRILPQGRAPRWTPTAVFDDGERTFITLAPEASVGEIPALFVLADGEPQLVNYRQVDGLLIVDRLFEQAELRLGARRPSIVRIHRLGRRTP